MSIRAVAAQNLVVVAAILGSISATQAAQEIKSFKIKKIDTVGKVLTVVMDKEVFTRDLKLTPETKIEINRTSSSIGQLKPGMQATAIVDVRAEKVFKIGVNVKGEESARPQGRKSSDVDRVLPTTGDLPVELKPIDDAILAYLRAEGVRGAAIAIVKDGKCVFARGYGHADRLAEVPVESAMLFPLDGVSKILTSAAIAKLADDGKVDLSAKFFDALGTKAVDSEDDEPDGSRFIDITALEMLKNGMRYQRDPLIKEYAEDREFRKKFHDKIKGLGSGEDLVLPEESRYDIDDLEYLLLGRLVARAGAGKYEAVVKQLVLGPIGAELPRLDVKKPVVEEKDTTTSAAEKRKQQEKKVAVPKTPEPFKDIVQVQFEAGRDYVTTSMSLDAAGGWTASALDLARLTKAYDVPEECPILKPESVPVFFSPNNEESGTQRINGWLVTVPGDRATSHLARRTIHSGPAAIASEGRLHIVVLLSTGFAASRSGAEHPLLAELAPIARGISTWPEVDLFTPATPTEEPTPEEMPSASVADADMPAKPRARLADIAKLQGSFGDKVMGAVSEFVGVYEEFLRSGGDKLLDDLRSTSAPDLVRIAGRNPKGVQAASAMKDKYVNGLIQKTFILQGEASGTRAHELAAAALTELGGAIGEFAVAVSNAFENAAPNDDGKDKTQAIGDAEERMFGALGRCLAKLDESFPVQVKPAGSDVEFKQVVDRLSTRRRAFGQQLLSLVANRSSRIFGILSQGGGAPARDLALLPQLFKEMQSSAQSTIAEFDALKAKVGELLTAETTAASKYAAVWQAFAELLDADVAYAKYVSTLSPESDPADEEKTQAAIADKEKGLAAALNATFAETPPADEAPAEGAPAADATTPPAESTPAPK